MILACCLLAAAYLINPTAHGNNKTRDASLKRVRAGSVEKEYYHPTDVEQGAPNDLETIAPDAWALIQKWLGATSTESLEAFATGTLRRQNSEWYGQDWGITNRSGYGSSASYQRRRRIFY